MKQEEIKITVTLGDILDAPYINSWSHMCEKYGINEWCLNEGRADREDDIKISLEDAYLYGIIETD